MQNEWLVRCRVCGECYTPEVDSGCVCVSIQRMPSVDALIYVLLRRAASATQCACASEKGTSDASVYGCCGTFGSPRARKGQQNRAMASRMPLLLVLLLTLLGLTSGVTVRPPAAGC